MKHALVRAFSTLLTIAAFVVVAPSVSSPSSASQSGAPPEGLAESDVPPELESLANLDAWERKEVVPTIGLQVGHWQNFAVPEELYRLRRNTGATFGTITEAEVNLAIAEKTKTFLEANGVKVDLIPATVPPGYWADAFIAIHADGSEDPVSTGYKFATPWRDLTGKANSLLSNLDQAYRQTTGLSYDPNISSNMRGYYAFSWWKFHHAIHPATPAVIAETGFLTNAGDRRLIVDQPDLAARGLALGILQYLESQDLLVKKASSK